MGRLTTHVLDTTHGKPAAALEIALYQRANDTSRLVKTIRTNADGRCDEPLLQNGDLSVGSYELVFQVEPYFAALGIDSPFLKDVVIRFHISQAEQHYHVPLLISPYSYSTYRGS